MLALDGVRLVSVAGVEALRQKEQTADPVAVLREVRRVLELIVVLVGVVGPDVLNLVAVLAAPLDVFRVPGRLSRLRFDVVSHACEKPVNLAAIGAVKAEAIVSGEGLFFRREALGDQRG